MKRNTKSILTILPGRVRFEDGTRADLAALARHHYRSTPPATYCRVRVARVRRLRRWRTVGVAVLSWPVPMMMARNRHFHVNGYRNSLRFANAYVRTISRVVVHPQYRAAGLAGELVRQLCARCPTRYVECATSMGDFAGFLIRNGFVALPTRVGEPAYFLFDRGSRRRGAEARSIDAIRPIAFERSK